MTGLSPASPEGHTALLIMFDPFGKWVEAHPLHPMSDEVIWIFYSEVVCHFGKPAIVRTDGGPKFWQSFVKYMAELDIAEYTPITPSPQGRSSA